MSTPNTFFPIVYILMDEPSKKAHERIRIADEPSDIPYGRTVRILATRGSPMLVTLRSVVQLFEDEWSSKMTEVKGRSPRLEEKAC